MASGKYTSDHLNIILYFLYFLLKAVNSDQDCLINSTSQLILTSSLTNTPPASSVAFQFNPHSLRLIFPLIVKPAFSLPHGSFITPPNSTSSFICLVIPLIVRSPYNV